VSRVERSPDDHDDRERYGCGMTTLFSSIRASGFHRGPDRMIGGVCGGIARHTNTSVGFVRLLTILLALTVVSWFVYLIVWALTPDELGSIPLERWLARG
jgi:phage shock protein PspC (stress-responsive transcriptional regulator)